VTVVRRSGSPDEQILRRTALRIGLQTAAGVAITVVGLAAVAVFVVLHNQHTADDQLIDMTIARADDVVDPPVGVWLILRRDRGEAASPGLPAGLPDESQLSQVAATGTATSVYFSVGEREYRIDTQPVADGGVIQAALDLSADQAERDRLVAAFLVSGLAGLVLAAAVGGWLGRRSVRPMAEALALQRRFVADAGHELRTPLTLLSTRAQLIRRTLARDTDPDAIRSDVDGLVRDAHHLTDILDDLLLAADPRETAVDEQVRLPVVVAQAVDSARPLAEERGVTLASATVAQPPAVMGAAASLRRAVTALLDNAIRHADGAVTVTVGVSGSSATVDVADDGSGIDPQLLPTLFERFATSPADGKPGVRRRYGLGLALVSEIAARHGGSVSVVQTGQRGATFRLRLPGA
jgi:signal transduction histidine kinase